MSAPYPTITDQEEVHDLVISHGDEESHERLFPNCKEWVIEAETCPRCGGNETYRTLEDAIDMCKDCGVIE